MKKLLFISTLYLFLFSQIFVNGAPTTTDAPKTTSVSSTTNAVTSAAPGGGSKEEAEMKIVVKKISELAKQIITLMEPASKQGEATVRDNNENTYFLSFMFKDKKSSNETSDGKGRRMTVNNNFSATHLNPTQTFVEAGAGQKQSPAHNVQLKNNISKSK